jgi:hypothetical protein
MKPHRDFVLVGLMYFGFLLGRAKEDERARLFKTREKKLRIKA